MLKVKMKRTTIKDLAEMLNISTSTVSRALKDHPDISSSVKIRVREAAETFNYIPNDFAVSFRKKSSKVIGLIVPEITMFFLPSIIKGISSVLNKEGYRFFILSSDDSYKIEKEHIGLIFREFLLPRIKVFYLKILQFMMNLFMSEMKEF